MPKRIEKVNSLLEHEIGQLIQREVFLPGAIGTLTYVATTPNLIEARVHISVYPEEKTDAYFNLLKRGLTTIQREINHKLNMRPVPKIVFLKDDSPKKAEGVERLFDQLKKEGK